MVAILRGSQTPKHKGRSTRVDNRWQISKQFPSQAGSRATGQGITETELRNSTKTDEPQQLMDQTTGMCRESDEEVTSFTMKS
jgi:hypothetical protein